MSNESVARSRGPVKARDYASAVRDLRELGVLADVQRICDEGRQPLPAILGRSIAPELCRLRWQAWLWLHQQRGVQAGRIAEVWGVAESTVYYGLGRAKVGHRLSLEACRERLARLGAVAPAEALCAELGVELPDLMQSKRSSAVQARRRLWRALVAAGRRRKEIAAAWGMERTAVEDGVRAMKEAA
jgi:hypothetical protein